MSDDVQPSTPSEPAFVLDSTLEKRGEYRVATNEIVLREWDEEVYLHECLHAALHQHGFIKYGYADPATAYISAVEEDVVSPVSRTLYDWGWRRG